MIGTWINGKPLYQKTWSIASPAEGMKLAENVDYCHVVSKEYSRRYSAGLTVDGDDFWYTANDYVNIRVVKNPNSSDMNLSVCYKASNNAFTLENLYLTVQYTKTTD